MDLANMLAEAIFIAVKWIYIGFCIGVGFWLSEMVIGYLLDRFYPYIDEDEDE